MQKVPFCTGTTILLLQRNVTMGNYCFALLVYYFFSVVFVFNDMKFICVEVNNLKTNNSVAFSTSQCCIVAPSVQFQTFLLPRKETLYLLAVAPYSLLPQPLATIHRLAVSLNLLIRDLSYKCSCVMCSIFCSPSFSQHVFRAHLCCGLRLDSILLYGYAIVFKFIYLQTDIWGFYHLLIILNNTAMNISIQVPVFSSFKYVSRDAIAESYANSI